MAGDAAAVVAIGGGAVVACRTFERTAESVGAARLHLEDVLVAHGVTDRDTVEAAVLLVSELGTDVLQHGRWPDFSVTVTLSASSLQVSLETAAQQAPAAPRPLPSAAEGSPRAPAPELRSDGVPDLAPHSRTIVEMVADSWDVRAAPRSRTAWFRLFR